MRRIRPLDGRVPGHVRQPVELFRVAADGAMVMGSQQSAIFQAKTMATYAPPTVSVSPATVGDVYMGQSTAFTAVAQGQGTVVVEWYVHGVLRATGPTYTHTWADTDAGLDVFANVIAVARNEDHAVEVPRQFRVRTYPAPTASVATSSPTTVYPYQQTTFTATVSGLGTLAVDWYVKGVFKQTTFGPHVYQHTWQENEVTYGTSIQVQAIARNEHSQTVVNRNHTLQNYPQPTLTLSSPASIVYETEPTTITATASGTGLAGVRWFRNGTLVATQTAAPYSYTHTWTLSDPTASTITAEAFTLTNTTRQVSRSFDVRRTFAYSLGFSSPSGDTPDPTDLSVIAATDRVAHPTSKFVFTLTGNQTVGVTTGGGWDPAAVLHLIIPENRQVTGARGVRGRGAYTTANGIVPATPGGPGGTAVTATRPLQITNNGSIAGGGGGGGAGASLAYTSHHLPFLEGGRGGYGAGAASSATSGEPGTWSGFSTVSGSGGAGGALAQPGSNGSPGTGQIGSVNGATNYYYVWDAQTAGGAAGKAVVGNGHITWINTGTRLGAVT